MHVADEGELHYRKEVVWREKCLRRMPRGSGGML